MDNSQQPHPHHTWPVQVRDRSIFNGEGAFLFLKMRHAVAPSSFKFVFVNQYNNCCIFTILLAYMHCP